MEAYSVSVRLSLINGVSAGLVALSKEFGRTSLAAAELQGRLNSIKKWALTGAIVGGAGLAILAAFKPALDQAKQFQNELTKFKLYGMGDEANRQAEKFVKSMNVMGSSYVDNMRIMTEAQGIFRESGKRTLREQLEGAMIATPILAKLAVIEASLNPDERGRAHAQDLAMLRFVEARGGANDPRTFASIADWGYRLSQSSGGIVDWSQLQQLTATSGAAGFNLSQDAISRLEPVIADLKGGRAGSGLRVAFQRLLGTQRGLPKQAVSEFLSLGIWDPSKVQLNSGGGISRFLGAPGEVLRDRTKFATDPVAFYTQDFLPAIARKYGQQILGNTPQARVERAAEISMVFGPGTAGAVFSQIDKLLPAIQRSLDAQAKQQGIGGAYNTASGTLSGKQLALQKEWNDLLEQMGEAILPIAVKGLSALLPILKGFSDWAQKNPALFKTLVQSIFYLGIAAVVSGAAMEIIALSKALRLVGGVAWARITPPLGNLASRLGGLARVGWAAISEGMVKVYNAVGGLEALKWGAIAIGIVGVHNAIQALADSLGQSFRDQNHIKTPPWMKPGFNPFTFHWGGDGYGGPAAPHGSSPHVRPSSYHGGATLHGAVYIDGKIAGKVILGGAVRRAGVTQASSAGFDGSNLPTPVGSMLVGV